MLDWDKLRIFHAVADAGSLTHAGDGLNLSQSAVEAGRSARWKKRWGRRCFTAMRAG